MAPIDACTSRRQRFRSGIDDFTVGARHGSPPDDNGFVAVLDHIV